MSKLESSFEWFDNLQSEVEIVAVNSPQGLKSFAVSPRWPSHCILWAFANMPRGIRSWEAKREGEKAWGSKTITSNDLVTWHSRNKDKCQFCKK